MVLSTTAAGTISQTARGLANFLTKSASEAAPTAFSLARSFTALATGRKPRTDGQLDKTSHHVGAHPAQADHAELHGVISWQSPFHFPIVANQVVG